MAAPQSPNLPNIQLIGQALDTFKAEVVKVANLPTWDQGATIITQLDQVMARMQQGFEQMETRMDQRFEQMETRVNQRFEQMETRVNQRFEQVNQRFEQVNQRFEQVNQRLTTMDASITTMDASIRTLSARLNATQHNTNAQFANCTAHSDNSPLVPLHHYITNERIDGFPATVGDIGNLNGVTTNRIIAALGGSTEGLLATKRLRLRRLVGVVPVPSA